MCRYCVVLLTPEGTKSSQPFEAFLAFAQANSQDTLQFMHAYSNRQPEFANALLPDSETFRGKSAVSRGPCPGPDPSSSRALALDSVSCFLGSFEDKFQETQKSLSQTESLLLQVFPPGDHLLDFRPFAFPESIFPMSRD